MKFGVSASFGVVVCCLISGASAFTFTSPNWSLERPENCPHVNNETHECSSIVSSNYICMSIDCCPGVGDESSNSETEDDDTNSDHDSTSCEYGRCVYFGRCTVYGCVYRCCDGFDRDYAGRCQNETGELECQNNGERRWSRRRGRYYCVCPRGFSGRSCEIPLCHCENMGECSVMDGEPHCVCPPGFSGSHCEQAVCHLTCANGGSCLSDGHKSVCKCPHGFVGETCDIRYENSGRCPKPEYESGELMDGIRIECASDNECPWESHCCNEGSNLICRRPATDECVVENDDSVYAVGERWSPTPCETCVCNTEGRHACYTMACAYPYCGEGVEPITDDDVCCPYCPECEYKGKTYADGASFQDDCNMCSCDKGHVTCTLMACPPAPKPSTCEHDGIAYSEGASFMDDCNECWCYQGHVNCTKMACPEPISCVYKGVVYADGLGFKDDCNDCRCDGGHVSCTEMACPPSQCTTDNSEVYESGTSFRVDCNTCHCLDGDLICTEINCGTDAKGCTHNGKNYKSGETFKMDCNTCFCRDGVMGCTKMACLCNTLECQNNGTCMVKGGQPYCACHLPFQGKLCEIKFENPKSCPKQEDLTRSATSECEKQCKESSDCKGDDICCMEGCHMICRQPSKTVCHYDGQEILPGQTYSPSPCKQCYCDLGGSMACAVYDCARLRCPTGQQPVTVPGKCCAECQTVENPENCPIPEDWTSDSNKSCTSHCDSSSDCKADYLCCKEGCHRFCRAPKNTVCHHAGKEFQPGEKYSSNPCEDCTCDERGFMACAVRRCALPICSNGQRPISVPDKCCMECPPPGPTPLKMRCPTETIVIQAPKSGADRIVLASNITMVKAMSSDGKALQIKYRPEYVEHCKCYDSVRAVKWFEAAATDNGSTERCRVPYVVKDSIPPVFLTCQENIYAFEDEAITYKKPTYKDNVAIAGEQCDMDPVSRTYEPGVYTFKYSIWDFNRNVATCRFTVSVSSRDTSFDQLPQGLKNRSSDKMNVALIAAPIAGLLAIIIMVVLFLLCCRFRRARENVSSPSQSSGSRAGYDNNIYAVPGDVIAPDYRSLPANHPAYHKDNMSIKSDYTFLPPPEYKEVAELQAPGSYANPDYNSIGSVKTVSDK